jgi:hypothetical protein
MTPLTRTVTRKTANAYDHHGAPLVVSLEPGDILSIRELRRKYTVSIGLHGLYTHLVALRVAEERKARAQEKRWRAK